MSEQEQPIYMTLISKEDRETLELVMSQIDHHGYAGGVAALQRLLANCSPAMPRFDALEAKSRDPRIWHMRVSRSGYFCETRIPKWELDHLLEPGPLIGHEVLRAMLRINIGIEKQDFARGRAVPR